MTEYPPWSTETYDLCDSDEAIYDRNRKEIQSELFKDTPVKTKDNNPYIDNINAYNRDRAQITQSLSDRLGLGQNSLPGAQQVRVATKHTDQMTDIPELISLGEEIESISHKGRDRNRHIVPQLDSTVDTRDSLNQKLDSVDLTTSPEKHRNEQTDRVKTNEDTNDNDTDKIVEFNKDKARKVYRKDGNEQRDREKTDEDKNDDIYESVKFNKGKATKVYEINIEKKKILKERREKALQNAKNRDAEKSNAQAALQAHTRASKASKDNQDIKMTDDATSTEDVHLPPHPHGKAKYPSQIKTSSKFKTVCTEPLLGDPLPGSQATTKIHGHKPDSGDIGIYELLIEGAPNPPDLEGIEEDQLLQIQQNIQDKLKQRDEEREKNITKRMKQYEEKYDFINKALLESVTPKTEMTQTDHTMASAKVKSADKMVMLPPLFDGTKPEMAKQHYERFNQYIKFQTKSGNIKDPIVEAIELFEHTLDKKMLVWFQEHKDKFVDLTTLKTMFLQRYNPWGKTKRDQLQSWNILTFDPKRLTLINTLT